MTEQQIALKTMEQIYLLKLLLGLAGGAIVTLLTLIAYFIRKWMTRIEGAVITLDARVLKLLKRDQIAQEREANTRGKLEIMCQSIDSQKESTGNLRIAVEKLWLVLQNAKLVETRLSDIMASKS